jgi:chromate reductase, NAD(P)H dehydrogenase (quinone)
MEVEGSFDMPKYEVGYLVGSLSSTSINRLLSKALVQLAPPELRLTEIAIRDLPLYSQDYDADFPPVARSFKQAIADVDAVLFVTPEYNRSIPGGLKNAIDWASRPYGQNALSRKPAGVIGASPGSIGTAVAQSHLRGVLCFCNAPLMNSVEAYVTFKSDLIDANATVSDDSMTDFLRKYMRAFLDFVAEADGAAATARKTRRAA